MKRVIKADSEYQSARKDAEYTNNLFNFMREELGDHDLIEWLEGYFHSDWLLPALKEIAEKADIDISEVK